MERHEPGIKPDSASVIKILGAQAKDLSDINHYIADHAKTHHTLTEALHQTNQSVGRTNEAIQRLTVTASKLSMSLTAIDRTVGKLQSRLLDDPNGGNVLTKIDRLQKKDERRDEDLKERVAERRVVGWRVVAGVATALVLAAASTSIGFVNINLNNRLVEVIRQQQEKQVQTDPAAITMSREQLVEAIREIVGEEVARQTVRRPSPKRTPKGGKPNTSGRNWGEIAIPGIPNDWIVYP